MRDITEPAIQARCVQLTSSLMRSVAVSDTPLAVISSYTQMLNKHMRDDERLAPILEKITQQTFRASRSSTAF